MANATLLEFLNEYISDLPVSVHQGVIQDIRYDEKTLNEITFVVQFPHIVPAADILEFEAKTGNALQVKTVRLDCRYEPSMFTKDIYPVLVEMLKRELPIINGFLNKADILTSCMYKLQHKL